MRAPLARLVAAATLVVAATVVLGPTAPASAASCTSADGVTVVVDPGALGGALLSACDGGAGQAASARYADAGVSLTYAQRQPGFVCRVNGVPASDPCVNTPPADAYWGLFWTDGQSGTWTYSSLGVTGLQVPEGGAVALAWQQGTTRRTPAIAAPVHAPAPTKSPTKSPTPTTSPTRSPSKSPTASPTRTPSPSPTTQSPSAPATPTSPTASATPSSQTSRSAPSSSAPASPGTSGTPRAKRSRTPSATPSSRSTDDSGTSAPEAADPASPDDESAPTADAPAADEGRVPTWLTLTVLGVLLAVTAALAVAARRRRGDQP